LGQFDVAFVELELFAVDEGAEGEVACDDEEDARDDTGGDGGDIGAIASASGRSGTSRAGNRSRGASIGIGVCDRFASCERSGGGGVDGGRECCFAVCVSSNYIDDGLWHGVAIRSFQASG
jgi:hypothetical protein